MEKTLFEHILKNKNLSFLDVDNNKSFSLSDANTLQFPKKLLAKSLIFLYLDNSLSSVKTLLAGYKSKHTLALLSNNLNVAYKENLENIYKPSIIFDSNRTMIEGYEDIENSTGIFFYSNKTDKIVINKNVKLLLSTSGSTGTPKFVKLSEDNIISNAMSIIDYLPIDESDTVPLNLPIYYSYGLSIFNTNSIRAGKIICTNKDVMSKDFWSDFTKYQYSTIAGVPYLYEILNRIGFTKKKLPSLRYLTQAGGKLGENLIKIFSDFSSDNNIKLYVMYGQTEATARMSYLPPDKLSTKLGSVGIPIKNGKFLIDEDSNELIYTGPNVFGGYADSKKDLESFSKNNFLRTGDIGFKDNDGFVYITGRIKRMIKITGIRINLDEVEKFLNFNFEEDNFLCTGEEDKKILVYYLNKNLDKDKVVKYLKEKIGLHHSNIILKQIDEVPLTINGKINYAQLTKNESK